MAGSGLQGAAAPGDLVELGRVLGAWGVRGWLKIQPHDAQAQALLHARTWWLQTPASGPDAGVSAGRRPVRVLASRRHAGRLLVAQLQGVADREQAQALQGCTAWVSRADFPAAATDEYYWVDLIGCDFWLAGEPPAYLGRVDEVFDNGAHAVLRVALGGLGPGGRFEARLDERGRPLETLVPFVAAHVHHVDIAARRLEGDWPADF